MGLSPKGKKIILKEAKGGLDSSSHIRYEKSTADRLVAKGQQKVYVR